MFLKTLLTIRHAKSSWDTGTLNDFDRPLNERGKVDAPVMAKRLIAKNIKVDSFVSSPAKRAKKTAELFAKEYGIPDNDIIFVSALYHASPTVFYEVVSQLADELNTVAIFSHNPGITEFVNSLVKEINLDNMPTCGIFAIKIKTKIWKDFTTADKEFLFFDYPKDR